MTANYSAGTVATYTCNDGFELGPGVGNSMRTCVPVEQMSDAASRSEFDGAEPRCEQRKCSGLLFNYSYSLGIRACIYMYVHNQLEANHNKLAFGN